MTILNGGSNKSLSDILLMYSVFFAYTIPIIYFCYVIKNYVYCMICIMMILLILFAVISLSI